MRKPGVDPHSDGKPVTFDEAMLKRLERTHATACKDGHASFTFDGREYSTKYAGYLIEYLRKQFGHGEPA